MLKIGLTTFGVAAVLLAADGACSKPAPPIPIKTYNLHGVVVSLDRQDHTAKVQHQEIKGFMEAMTMDYAVKDSADWAKLRPGETIDATLYVQDLNYWIGNVRPAK